MQLKGVELFRCGRWNAVKTFTEADLEAMVESFAALKLAGRTPLKFGHNDEQPLTDGQPALGWLSRVWREGKVLFGDFADVPRVVYDAINAGNYKFVSVELLRDVMAGNKEYPWVLSAVALLGADIPAVSGLKDLQQLTMARQARFSTGTRYSFTTGGRDSMDDAQTLKAEVKRLNGQLIKNAFDTAVRERRILPRDRHAFESRMGEDATLEDAQRWITATPRPEAFTRDQRPGGGRFDSRAEAMPEGDRPDTELVALTQEAVEKSGGKLDYFTAQRQVLRTNPELAQRYRHQPGTRD